MSRDNSKKLNQGGMTFQQKQWAHADALGGWEHGKMQGGAGLDHQGLAVVSTVVLILRALVATVASSKG